MDDEAIKISAARLGAWVDPFYQPDAACAGYVAWWIRSRLQNEDEGCFREECFGERGKTTLPANSQTDFSGFVSGTYGDVPRLRGAGKALALQRLFADASNQLKIQGYIILGIREDKAASGGKFVASLVNVERGLIELGAVGVSGGSGGVYASVCKALDFGWVARFGFRTSGGSHSVGVDCSDDRIVYFDPNVGVFRFRSLVNFGEWWNACYLSRQSGVGNAFYNYGNMFDVEFYKANG